MFCLQLRPLIEKKVASKSNNQIADSAHKLQHTNKPLYTYCDIQKELQIDVLC